MIKLKNGTKEPNSVVIATLEKLASIVGAKRACPWAVFDLLSVCRDKGYKPRAVCIDFLNQAGLMDTDGNVSESMRNVILSSFEVAGQNIKAVYPMADDKCNTLADELQASIKTDMQLLPLTGAESSELIAARMRYERSLPPFKTLVNTLLGT